jgi:hypothetical protein
VEAASWLWNKFLLAFLYLAVMFCCGGGGPVRGEPSGSGGPVGSSVCVGSYFGALSRRLSAVMSAAEFLSLRVISGGGGNASSRVKLVRYVVHKLEKSGLCFHIPFLGFLLPSGGGRPSRRVATDPLPYNEDLADWRSPARSSFQVHIDFFGVLLRPLENFDVSSFVWGSVSSFGLGVFLYQAVVEQTVEWQRLLPGRMNTSRTSTALQCNFSFFPRFLLLRNACKIML